MVCNTMRVSSNKVSEKIIKDYILDRINNAG
jgi:hypothetical protein